MTRFLSAAAIALAVSVSVSAAPATQNQSPPAPPTFKSSVVNTWKRLHDKILAMAKDTLIGLELPARNDAP